MACRRSQAPDMRVLAGTLALMAAVSCAAVLLFSAKGAGNRPAELFFADHMDGTGSAGLSTRLPSDRGLGAGLPIRDSNGGDGLSDGFAAAHWGSNRLPEDSKGQAKIVHGGLPSDMTDPLDSNKASALRSQNFKTVLSDCEAKGNCKELLGTQMWNVLSQNRDRLIADDYDDDRKVHDARSLAGGKLAAQRAPRSAICTHAHTQSDVVSRHARRKWPRTSPRPSRPALVGMTRAGAAGSSCRLCFTLGISTSASPGSPVCLTPGRRLGLPQYCLLPAGGQGLVCSGTRA
jgi:hypothetical protein